MSSNATAPRTPKAYTRRIKSASISWYNHCCYIFDFCLRAMKNVSCPSARDRQLAAWTPLRTWDSVQLLPLTKAKPASCSSGHNISQTSCSSHPSPTSWKHSCTAIYSQTSFLCPQFRELLESFLLHLTGVTSTKQPIKFSMGDYILTSINSYTSFTAVEDWFSSESNVDLWNVFVPASSSVASELDTNPQISSRAPLWGCNEFCSTGCSLPGLTGARATVHAVRCPRLGRGLGALVSIVAPARVVLHTWPVVTCSTRLSCISRPGVLLCTRIWLLHWLWSQSWELWRALQLAVAQRAGFLHIQPFLQTTRMKKMATWCDYSSFHILKNT